MAISYMVDQISEFVGIKERARWAVGLKLGSAFLLLTLVGVGSYISYRWYRVSREQEAQKLLGDYLVEFQKAMQDGTEQAWSDVGSLFKLGYDHYSGTKTGVYFLAFQADALIKQGKRVQAVEVLNTVINQLGAGDIAPLFALKRALIKLDIFDDAVVEQGLTELRTLAQDKNNPYQDTAHYYLGLYYWTQNQNEQAKLVWQQLVDEAQGTQEPRSPWVRLAEEKLAQLV